MDIETIKNSYQRWAPVYDATFGQITHAGRRAAVRHINTLAGRVLEVGVGTGLALDLYARHLHVTGIDYSEAMLRRARDKVKRRRLNHVEDLRQMDARALDFPDQSFDVVAAMHVLSVVPEPTVVMREIARVLRPGGQLVITNHFKHERGLLAVLARAAAPLDSVLGWHSDFEIKTVLQEPQLAVLTRSPLPPMRMMTLLVMERQAA